MLGRFLRKRAHLTKSPVNSRARSWPWSVPSFEQLERSLSGVCDDALHTFQLFIRPSRRARRKKHTARLLGSEQLECRVVLAVAWTGLPDYHPNSTALIAGTGFAVGETVELQVVHADGTPSPGDAPWFVVDGGASDRDGKVDGNFQTSWYVGPDCAGATLDLTARGLSSGAVADWVFTDSVTTAPTTASVTTPANGSAFSSAAVPATFSGSVADYSGGAGLAANSTTFTLQRSSNNLYWTGSAWQAAVFNLAATNSATTGNTAATWTSSAKLPTWSSQSDGTFTVQATATDKGGNAFTGTAVSFTLDNVAPTTASVTTPAGGSRFRASTVPATFSGGVADNSGGAGLNANSTTFTLQRSSDNSYWTGSAWQAAVFNLATTHGATTGNTAATWTDNVTLPTWSSQSDGTYTIQVKATDKAGNSFTGAAVSFTLDKTAPITASVTTPASGSSFRAASVPASFSGGVADNSGGVGLAANSTTFTLQRSSDNNYWTGSAWQAAAFNLAASNSATTGNTAATWTSSATLPTWASQANGTYTIQATATDAVGNTFTGTAVSFTLDSTAPTTAWVTTPANGSSFRVAAVPASFSGSVADNTGGAGLAANSATFTLQRGSDGFYWTGSAWQAAAFSLAASNAATTGGAGVIWTSNATLPTWSSQAGGTYTVQATATDRAGNTFTGTAVSFNLDTTPATLGTFELDGNATTQTTHDWDQVYNDAVVNPGQNKSGSIPGAVAFIHDPDISVTGGQSKDTNDVNEWGWTTGTPQDKATLLDVFAAAYSVPSGGENHTILDFGADRYDNVGSTTLGFWFFQNPISKNPNGTFSGAHTVGDIFIVADFSSAVATINVYKWVGSGGSDGSLQAVTVNPNSLFATVNTVNTPSGGWPFADKSGTPNNTFLPGEFFEGGIDVTALGLPSDLSSFVAETRSSTSVSASLSAVVVGSTFDTAAADLSITKTDNKGGSSVTGAVGGVVPGTGETYTIVVSNSGPSAVTGASVVDTLPAFFTSDTWTATQSGGASGFSASGSGNINDTVNLPVVSSITYTVTGTVSPSATGTLINTATVTAPAGVTDPNLANNTATDTDTITPPSLSVTETGNGTVNSTDPVSFTIVVSNATGAGTGFGVVLSDPLPGGLAWTTDAGTITNGTLTDTIGNLAAGSSVTIHVDAPTASGYSATLNNTATSTPTNGAAASGSATDVVQAPSLGVTETGNGTVSSTDTASFTIVVRNAAGAGTAYGVVLSDPLPGGLAWTSDAGTISSGTLTDTIGNLAAGSSVTIHVNAVTPSGYSATLNNTATATPTNGSAASGSATDVVQAPSLSVTETGNGTVNSTDTVSFTIVVSNTTGAGTAYDVVLSDPLPGGLAWTSDGGTISGGTLTDTIGNLAAGSSVTIHLSAPTPSGYSATLNNTATATPTNGSAASGSATDVVKAPSLSVTDTSNGTVNSTDTASFTIVVSNATGAGTAYGVVLSDPLPGGLAWTTDAGTISGGTLSDTIGNLAAGSSVTIHVNAPTPSNYSATLNNTATATPTNGAAASGSATNVVKTNTLSVTETGNGTVNSTDTASFTIVVSNAAGAGTAYGVVLSDPLPGGLAWTSDAGTISSGTLTDAIGNLAAGSSVTIHVRETP